MKMRTQLLRLAVLSALVAVPARADAPGNQYFAFDAHATTILDVKTSLSWQRTAAGPFTFTQAKTTTCSGSSRLPTVKELLTLVDEQPHKEYVGQSEVTLYIDESAFGRSDSNGDVNTPVGASYWTQTPGGTGHWGLDFSTGTIAPHADSEQLYVRCVTDKTH